MDCHKERARVKMKLFKKFIVLIISIIIHFVPIIGLYFIYHTLQTVLSERRVARLCRVITKDELMTDRGVNIILSLILLVNLCISIYAFRCLFN